MHSRARRRHIGRKVVLKVLFQTKRNLPDGSAIRGVLPYYWYKNGPHSDVIYGAMDGLQADGRITASASNAYKTYMFDRNRINIPLVKEDEDIAEAKRAIADVVDEFTHRGAMLEDVYADAPYKWYDTYNLKFKSRIDNFCNKTASQHDVDESARAYVMNALEDAVLDFPQSPDFSELYRTFMGFVRLLNSFLNSKDCMESKDMLPAFKDLSDRIWDVFAYGVRIKAHDAYYDDRIHEWTAAYKNELAKLDAHMHSCREKIEPVCTYEVRIAPEIADMKSHPEKYDFTPLNLGQNAN